MIASPAISTVMVAGVSSRPAEPGEAPCSGNRLVCGPNWSGVGAGMAVGAIALQSLLDYPLRNQTLLCVAGVLVVLLVIRRERSATAP
jgi:hypothetical protein